MMPPDAVQIVKQEDDAKWNADNTVSKLVKVTFMVGTHGPFTERFPREGFTAQDRDAKLTAFAREIWVDPPLAR